MARRLTAPPRHAAPAGIGAAFDVAALAMPGFDERRIRVGDIELHVAVGGSGPPVVLLHGFPQHHLAWRLIAPGLVDRARVICPDLRGYGHSDKPVGDDSTYSKRTMDGDIVGLLDRLGEPSATLIGHDRGALVAFRAALDHPERVDALGVIGIVPTVDLWEHLNGPAGVHAAHLFFLAQPTDLPARMIGADPELFFGHFLDGWSRTGLPEEARRSYLATLAAPDASRAVCADYRAGALIDGGHDAADRAAGRRLTMPVLAVWEDPGDTELPFDPAEIWARWAPDLATRVLPGGHLLPEDCPAELTAAIADLLERRARAVSPPGSHAAGSA